MTRRTRKKRASRARKPGCCACKRRQLECDEVLPTCQNCESSGRVCQGRTGTTKPTSTTHGYDNQAMELPTEARNPTDHFENWIPKDHFKDCICEPTPDDETYNRGESTLMVLIDHSEPSAKIPGETTLGDTSRKTPDGQVSSAVKREGETEERDTGPVRSASTTTRSRRNRTKGATRTTGAYITTVEDKRLNSALGLDAFPPLDEPLVPPQTSEDSEAVRMARSALMAVTEKGLVAESMPSESIQWDQIFRSDSPRLSSSPNHSMPGMQQTYPSNHSNCIPSTSRDSGEHADVSYLVPSQDDLNHRHDPYNQRIKSLPGVTFTLGNHIRTDLPMATTESLVKTFSMYCQVLLRPEKDQGCGIAYPVDVIVWQHSPEFYKWYAAETKTAQVSTLRFDLFDVNYTIGKMMSIPRGNLYSFQALKQCIWDYFWAASELNHGPTQFKIMITPAPHLDQRTIPYGYSPNPSELITQHRRHSQDITTQFYESSSQLALSFLPPLPEMYIRLQEDKAGKLGNPYSKSVLGPKITLPAFFSWFAHQTGHGSRKGPFSLKFILKDAVPCPLLVTLNNSIDHDFSQFKQNVQTEFEKAKKFMLGLREFVVLVSDPDWVPDSDIDELSLEHNVGVSLHSTSRKRRRGAHDEGRGGI